MGTKKLTTREKNEIIKYRFITKPPVPYNKIALMYDVDVRAVYEIVVKYAKENGLNLSTD